MKLKTKKILFGIFACVIMSEKTRKTEKKIKKTGKKSKNYGSAFMGTSFHLLVTGARLIKDVSLCYVVLSSNILNKKKRIAISGALMLI